MNRLTRLIFVLIGLVGMAAMAVFGAIVYPLGNFSSMVDNYLNTQPWALQTIAIVALVLFIVFALLFLIGLFARPKTRALYILTPVGTIRLTQNMIEQTIFHAVQEKNVLKQPQVYTRLKKSNNSVYTTIRGGLIPTSHVVDAASELQLHVEQQLKQLLQIDHVRVEVRIDERQQEKQNKNVPRVI
ncbi:alkaline shock response membrane anchor protein AmaP [Paenibacillus campi]|uniref:alkaline shock response membrane anchor protein AmaP n=1 Tax=Paenibacillus campi TaxID=3106031 RepID=UPI002AFF8F3B|nr:MULTISPECIES: alkaline shock response membrane anchor protein AmaP [unclassified Paenibacillus]